MDQNEPEKEKSRAEGGGGVCHCRGPGPAHLAEAYEALCPSSSGQVAGMVFSRDRADLGCGCRPPPQAGSRAYPSAREGGWVSARTRPAHDAAHASLVYSA